MWLFFGWHKFVDPNMAGQLKSNLRQSEGGKRAPSVRKVRQV